MVMGFMFLTGFYYDGNINAKLSDVTVELGEKLPDEVLNYTGLLVGESNLALESNVPVDKEGNTSKIGKYSYYLVYNDDDYGFSRFTNVKAMIKVVDTTKPVIILKENVEIEYGHSFNTTDIATCVDLSKCKVSIMEEIDTSSSGEKEITVKAIDQGNNVSYAKTKVTVLEKPKPVVTYYSYSSYSINPGRNMEINNSLSEEEKDQLRSNLVEFAKQFVGNPYVYGGTSLTNGADCSGFVMSVYANFGYSVPRGTGDYPSLGIGVSESELKLGDIVVYNGHVGIYAGGGMMVHASTPEGGIKYAPVYNEYHVYRRVIY